MPRNDDLYSQVFGPDDPSRGPQSIGQLIRYHRERQGWSQEEFGYKLKGMVDQARISLWERDLATPRKSRLLEIARLFGISPKELTDATRTSHGSFTFDYDNRYLDAFDDVQKVNDPKVTELFIRIVAAIASLIHLMHRKNT
jgi:transcriptional regulator with XRE-family HTH domain